MNSALIKRLRKIATLESEDYGAEPQDHSSWQAADLIERQAAQIEMMREALSKIEYLESANGCIMSAGDCSSVATEALSTTPDQALEQFAAKVREQCAKMCEAEYVNVADGDDEVYNSAITHASRGIRAIKELP